MKSYSEFMEYIKENVTDYLPERFESAEITIRQVVKNNDVVLDGLLISSPDSHISRKIIREYAKQVKNMGKVEDLARRICYAEKAGGHEISKVVLIAREEIEELQRKLHKNVKRI